MGKNLATPHAEKVSPCSTDVLALDNHAAHLLRQVRCPREHGMFSMVSTMEDFLRKAIHVVQPFPHAVDVPPLVVLPMWFESQCSS